MKKIKLEDFMPRALIRNKDGSFKYPTKVSKHVVTTSRQQERQNSDLDALTPQARQYVERELIARRFSLHWLRDPSTRDFVEIAAMQVVEAKRMPDEAKTKLREEKQIQRVQRKEKIASLISIATIAQQLKIIPRVARAALRASKTPKPAHGWAFHPSDVNKIKETIACQLSTTPSASPRNALSSLSTRSKRTSSAQSRSSTKQTNTKDAQTTQTKSTKNSNKPSKKSVAASGSSKRVAKTARSTTTKGHGPARGTARKSSTRKNKRK